MSSHQAVVNQIASAAAQAVEHGANRVELLGALSENIFGAVAQGMVDLGWSVFPQERGGRRKPAKVHGRTIRTSEDYDLANKVPPASDLKMWVGHCASHNVACVFGPASGNTFAVDVDVLDQAMSDEVVAIAEAALGATPFMRIGRAPKIALLYRHAADDVVRGTSKRLAGEKGHMVEILGVGRQLTFHGRHHITGNYFRWVGSASPLIDGPELSTLVTTTQVDAFLKAVEDRFGFAKTIASHSSFAWSEDGAEGGIRVARVDTGSDSPITDGREEYLGKLVWRTVCANDVAVVTAREQGVNALKPLLSSICQAVFDEFVTRAKADGRWTPPSLRTEISSRVARAADDVKVFEKSPGGFKGDGRQVIKIEAGEVEAAVDAGEAALVRSNRGLYQRGGQIVQLGTTPVITAQGRHITAQRLFEVQENALVEHLSSAARWEKWDDRRKSMARCSAPTWVAKTLMERKGRLRLPVITGVVAAPTLRADGSILETEGYDEATGLLLDFEGVKFPNISQSPTREQAVEALAKINWLISGFPFVGAADRAGALSGVLTSVIRRSLRTAPLHAASAPVAGSGKSHLMDVLGILVYGHEIGVLAQGETDEEDQKRVGAALLGGDPIISWDNCERPLGGPLWNQLLTQVTVRTRILGTSKAPEIENSALLLATGQHVRLKGDMTRRSLLIRLDPKCERPELKTFDFDPVVVCKARRAEFVVAALTVLRAYHVAGNPQQQSRELKGFEAWSNRVRDALMWLGEVDACLTQNVVRDLDPVLDSLKSVMAQWKLWFGGNRITGREIVSAAIELTPPQAGVRPDFIRPDLREALLAVAEQGGTINNRRLGNWIAQSSDRLVDGCTIVRDGMATGGVQYWRLKLSEQEQAAIDAEQEAIRIADGLQGSVESAARAAFLDASRAIAWLTTPQHELGGTPMAVSRTIKGRDACYAVLNKVVNRT